MTDLWTMSGIPIAPLRTRDAQGKREVWDILRKKWVVLTPEEHVRQSLIHYLTEHKGYPRTLMSLEKGLSYHGVAKRYDLLLFDRAGLPLIACECKAPYVALDTDVLLQLAVYNAQLQAPYLILCNGKELIPLQKTGDGIRRMEELPGWADMCME